MKVEFIAMPGLESSPVKPYSILAPDGFEREHSHCATRGRPARGDVRSPAWLWPSATGKAASHQSLCGATGPPTPEPQSLLLPPAPL